MSLFPVIVVFGFLPTDIFRIAFVTGYFLAGASDACADGHL